jgi:hypothetical protein
MWTLSDTNSPQQILNNTTAHFHYSSIITAHYPPNISLISVHNVNIVTVKLARRFNLIRTSNKPP